MLSCLLTAETGNNQLSRCPNLGRESEFSVLSTQKDNTLRETEKVTRSSSLYPGDFCEHAADENASSESHCSLSETMETRSWKIKK